MRPALSHDHLDQAGGPPGGGRADAGCRGRVRESPGDTTRGKKRGEKMKSYQFREYGEPLALAQRPTPEPAGTEVLVRVRACGVCHSDLHLWQGYFEMGGGRKLDVRAVRELPFTLGHEIAGEVAAAGPDAEGRRRRRCPRRLPVDRLRRLRILRQRPGAPLPSPAGPRHAPRRGLRGPRHRPAPALPVRFRECRAGVGRARTRARGSPPTAPSARRNGGGKTNSSSSGPAGSVSPASRSRGRSSTPN